MSDLGNPNDDTRVSLVGRLASAFGLSYLAITNSSDGGKSDNSNQTVAS